MSCPWLTPTLPSMVCQQGCGASKTTSALAELEKRQKKTTKRGRDDASSPARKAKPKKVVAIEDLADDDSATHPISNDGSDRAHANQLSKGENGSSTIAKDQVSVASNVFVTERMLSSISPSTNTTHTLTRTHIHMHTLARAQLSLSLTPLLSCGAWLTHSFNQLLFVCVLLDSHILS